MIRNNFGIQFNRADGLANRLGGTFPLTVDYLKQQAFLLIHGAGHLRYGSDIELRLVSLITKRPVVLYSSQGTLDYVALILSTFRFDAPFVCLFDLAGKMKMDLSEVDQTMVSDQQPICVVYRGQNHFQFASNRGEPYVAPMSYVEFLDLLVHTNCLFHLKIIVLID